MTDEDDRSPVIAQPLEVLEQLFGFGRSQHRRRLVQDQNLDAPVESFEDLHPLLLADREVFDERVWIYRKTIRRRQVGHPLFCSGVVHQGPTFGPQDDVLGDGEAIDEHEVLMNHPDAQSDRLSR